MLPLVKGGLATTALFVFILNWSDFLIALVLAGNKIVTAPVFLSQINSAATGQEFGSRAALGVILITPPLLPAAPLAFVVASPSAARSSLRNPVVPRFS